jgi:phosphohistidine phosphatase
MKYLSIIRHAKAEPESQELEDHDRKLISKGIKRASSLAIWLSKKPSLIESLHYSSSIRTSQTADIILSELKKNIETFIEPKLYGASQETLLNYISFIDDRINSVGIVGHQPGLKELALYLANSYAEGLERVLNENFATSNAMIIALNVKRWDQISIRSGILVDYFDSKNN